MNITNNTKIYFSKNAYEAGKTNVKLQLGDAEMSFSTVENLVIKNYDAEGKEAVTAQVTKDDLKPKNSQEIQDKAASIKTSAEGKENQLVYPKIYQSETKTIEANYTVQEYRLSKKVILNQYLGFPEISQRIKLVNAFIKQEEGTLKVYHQRQTSFSGISFRQ